jgi:hypothetical protein
MPETMAVATRLVSSAEAPLLIVFIDSNKARFLAAFLAYLFVFKLISKESIMAA